MRQLFQVHPALPVGMALDPLSGRLTGMPQQNCLSVHTLHSTNGITGVSSNLTIILIDAPELPPFLTSRDAFPPDNALGEYQPLVQLLNCSLLDGRSDLTPDSLTDLSLSFPSVVRIVGSPNFGSLQCLTQIENGTTLLEDPIELVAEASTQAPPGSITSATHYLSAAKCTTSSPM